MSIKKHETLSICCDGPCGTVINGSTPKLPNVPLEWSFVRVERGVAAGGNIETERALLCYRCFAKMKEMLIASGFSFSLVEKREKQPESDPTAERLGAKR